MSGHIMTSCWHSSITGWANGPCRRRSSGRCSCLRGSRTPHPPNGQPAIRCSRRSSAGARCEYAPSREASRTEATELRGRSSGGGWKVNLANPSCRAVGPNDWPHICARLGVAATAQIRRLFVDGTQPDTFGMTGVPAPTPPKSRWRT